MSENQPFPLPSPSEKHLIVPKVNEWSALFDITKECIREAQTPQNQLAETVVSIAID